MAKKTTKQIDENTARREVARAQKERRTARINCDGGLVLIVTETGSARFLHRYSYKGRWPTRWFPGEFPADLSLYQARLIRDADLEVLAKNLNPADEVAREVVSDPTLAEFVRAHFKALAPPAQRKWFETPERSAWFRSLTVKAGTLAQTKIDAIAMNDVVTAVKPFWIDGCATPTGRKLVFSIQRALEHRSLILRPSEPYHKWLTLPAVQAQPGMGDKFHIGQEHAALAFEDAPEVVAALRASPLMAARLAEFVILAGVRSREALFAKWGEINWGTCCIVGRESEDERPARTWTVPPERLKTEQGKGAAGRPFVVPLSLAMVRVLRRAAEGLPCKPDDYIFPSFHHGRLLADRPYAPDAGLRAVQAIAPDVTLHGFRTTLDEWGIEVPHRRHDPFSLELIDRVLGHGLNHAGKEGEATKRVRLSKAIGNYVRKGNADPFIPRRRIVLREWSRYLAGEPKPAPPPLRAAIPEAHPHLRLAA